jgi:hypothetical protein
MVRWGHAKVPELAHEPRVTWPSGPERPGITTHLATGLQLKEFQSDWNDRGMNREALLFWALQRFGRHNHHKYPTGPFPSRLQFQPHGVPEELHGTFRHPVWERLQAGQ